MKRILFAVLLSLVCAVDAYPSNITIPQRPGYQFRSTVFYQDDFQFGTTSSANVGSLGWNAAGTVNVATSIANNPGLLNISTGAVSGTTARINQFGGLVFSFANPFISNTVFRLNTNDANTTVRWGATSGWASNPPTDGWYFEKLDADVNWFCVTRASSVQTRVDSGVAITTSFTTFNITRNSSGVSFMIGTTSVCSSPIATNVPTSMNASVGIHIINSAAASKDLDMDYYDFMLMGLVR